MPEKPTKASAINPITIIVIPGPSNPLGTLALFNLCLIPANATMANVQPIPEPKLNPIDCNSVYSLITINNETPNIAQLTVINGKNIPSA